MKKTILLSGILMLGAAALPAHAQQTVTFLGYSGLFQERYTKAVIEPFMAANPDIKIEYFPQQGSAAMLGFAARLQRRAAVRYRSDGCLRRQNRYGRRSV